MDSEPLSERRPGLLVTICGVGVSALALFVVHWLNDHDINAMGFYLNGVIPVGALLVGIAAGSGYAVASRVLQVRLDKRYIWGMLATGLITYWSALYVTYQHAIEQAGIPPAAYPFQQYLIDSCEQMAFAPKNKGEQAKPLGGWGYPLKLLEMIGFVGGGMIPAGLVSGLAYCRKCQKYLKPHRSGYLHAPQRWADVKPLAKQLRTEGIQQACADVAAQVRQCLELLATAKLADVEALVAKLDPAADKTATARVLVAVEKCPTCESHVVTLTMLNYTVDKQDNSTVLQMIEKFEQIG